MEIEQQKPSPKQMSLLSGDNQIGLRRFRIELGEIENVMSQNPTVSQVVTVTREDEPGAHRLICCRG